MPKNKTALNAAYVWALTRISIGFVFIWAFADKLLGLGFATCRDRVSGAVNTGCDAAWLNGGSPTSGFLTNGTSGPLADFYQSLAGQSWADWLFMAGLLLIGVALVFGIAMKLATFSGALLLMMMWSATLWPANNPLIDDHVVYALVLVGLYLSDAGSVWGLSKWWHKQDLVKKYPILK